MGYFWRGATDALIRSLLLGCLMDLKFVFGVAQLLLTDCVSSSLRDAYPSRFVQSANLVLFSAGTISYTADPFSAVV